MSLTYERASDTVYRKISLTRKRLLLSLMSEAPLYSSERLVRAREVGQQGAHSRGEGLQCPPSFTGLPRLQENATPPWDPHKALGIVGS